MNVKLLKKVMAAIKKEPKQFNMDLFFSRGPKIPNCGTACCIGGWAITIAGRYKNPAEADEKRTIYGESQARDLLDLTHHESERLFFESDWPEPFHTQHREARSAKTRANVAIARIKHFIKTGK